MEWILGKVEQETWKKKQGLEAKAYVKDLLENSDEGKFSIISHGRGKYGRVLGEIFVKGHEKSVNELLKENGHAYEYHGEKKKVFKFRRGIVIGVEKKVGRPRLIFRKRSNA